MTRKRREARQTELRYVSDYIAKHYPGRQFWTNLRIGAPHPSLLRPDLEPAEIRLLTGWKRRLDALVVMDHELHLIEGMIRPDPYHICRLEHYALLLPHTPELAEFKEWPVVQFLVYPIEDPVVTYLARLHNVRAVHWRPLWLADIMKTLPHRLRRASLTWPVGERR